MTAVRDGARVMSATLVRLGVMKLIGVRVTGSREDLVERVPKAWRCTS